MIVDWSIASRSVASFSGAVASVIAGATALFLAALAVHALLGRKRPLVRSAVWNATLLASLLLPAFSLGLPRLRIACLPAQAAVVGQRLDEAGPGFVDRQGPRPSEARLFSQEPARPVSMIAPSDRGTSPPITPTLWSWAVFARCLAAFYLAGVGLLGVRLIASVAAVSRLKREARIVDDPRWVEPLSRWCDRLRLGRPVALARSGRVRVPLVLGWRRPMIVLPEVECEADIAPESQIDAILVHELAHLRRGDDVWNLAQQVVQILYWPHPLMWLIARFIADVREQACDEFCVHWAGGAEGYRSALVAVASRLVHSPARAVPTSLGLAMARKASPALAGRLAWIARSQGSSSCRLAWPGRVMTGLIVVVAAGLISTVQLTRAQGGGAKAAAARDGTVRAYRQPLRPAAKFRTMTLTVLDDETNKPLSDVEVTVLNYVEVKDYRFPTDSTGRLRFEYPYIGVVPTLSIEVRKNGYVPVRTTAYRHGDLDQKPVEEQTIRLRRGVTAGGRVVDEADRPVEGVTAVMTVSKYGPGKRPQNPTGYEIYYEIPTKTGRDGMWQMDSFPPGAEQVNLQLIHPDYVMDGTTTLAEARRSPKIADLLAQSDRQVLKKGVRIVGQVVDEGGKPIKGVRIVDSTRGLTFADFMREAFTDDGGDFHLHFGRGERIRLSAQAKGYETVSVEIKPEPDTPLLEFHLEKSKVLRGRVVDPAGKPISAVSVSFFDKNPGRQEIDFLTYTDAEGRFEWDSAPETATYQVWAEGYKHIKTISLTAGDTEAVVVLNPAFNLTLRVVDAETGKPIDGFGVELGSAMANEGEYQWENPSSHRDGIYYVSRELAGVSYRFKISAPGYAPVQTRDYRDSERVVRDVIKLSKEKK